MLIRIILYAVIIYLIIRFVTRFVMPVFQVTRTVQGKMREMQEQMEKIQHQEQAKSHARQKPIEGDYIDFEEVK